jgi:hypothetical protein
MNPLRDQGSACLSSRKRVARQKVIAQSNRPEVQSVDRVKAHAEGQAVATRRCRRVGHDF